MGDAVMVRQEGPQPFKWREFETYIFWSHHPIIGNLKQLSTLRHTSPGDVGCMNWRNDAVTRIMTQVPSSDEYQL